MTMIATAAAAANHEGPIGIPIIRLVIAADRPSLSKREARPPSLTVAGNHTSRREPSRLGHARRGVQAWPAGSGPVVLTLTACPHAGHSRAAVLGGPGLCQATGPNPLHPPSPRVVGSPPNGVM